MQLLSSYKYLCLFILSLLLFVASTTQSSAQTKIQWQNIQQIDNHTNQLVFIFMYADWCGWCKKMEQHTFTDTNFVSLVNTSYAAFRLNAESKDTIRFDRYPYTYSNLDRTHELALKLSNGSLALPMVLILEPQKRGIFTFNGYRTAKDFELILKYFATHTNISQQSFTDYQNKFISEWK